MARREVIPAAVVVSGPLNGPLPFHTRQYAVSREILGLQCDQQSGVCVFPAPAGIAHAVGADPAGFAARGEYIPAGTHAKRISAAAVRQPAAQGVIRRRQVFSPAAAVLGAVDGVLPLLNAHAHGKCLALHGQTHFMQPREGIPGAVPDGENGAAGLDEFLSVDHNGVQLSVHGGQPRDFRAEPYFPAQIANRLPDIPHHLYQHIGADVGFRVVTDMFRRAVGGELLQNPLNTRVVGVGMQFSVGKRPRPALAELHVGFRVQGSAPAEVVHGLLPGFHVRAALQHDGPCARHGQHQRREHPAGAEADHHRAVVQRGDGDVIRKRRVYPGGFAPGRGGVFVAGKGYGDGVYIMNVRFFPGVQGLFGDFPVQNGPFRHPQGFCRQTGEPLFRFAGAQLQSADRDHRAHLPAR